MFISFLRTVILYSILVLAVRLMGKRQLGELEPSEFVVAILIADLASVPMQDIGIPLLSGVIPILTVLALELMLSVFSLRWVRFRRFFCGNPIILVENGEILQKNLAKTRITADELLQHLRENGILELPTVQYAILETDGQISTIVHPKHAPPTAIDAGVQVDEAQLPITLITGGVVLADHFPACGKDGAWLEKQLRRLGCKQEDVFLLTATKNGKIYLSVKEAPP